jgi:uncharacterized protein YbaR (Trm112 family)
VDGSTTAEGTTSRHAEATLGGKVAVDVEPRLLEVLACPCPQHGALRPGLADDAQADYLSCEVCGRAFPVRDGIPVLLLEEAVGGPADPAPGASGKG